MSYYGFWSGKIKEVGKSDDEYAYVYFIQGKNTKNIKIGYTINLKQRLSQCQTGSGEKLYYLGTILFPSSSKAKQIESLMHIVFEEYKIQGEWFTPSTVILDFIKNNKKDSENLTKYLFNTAHNMHMSNRIKDLHKAGTTKEGEVLILKELSGLFSKKYDLCNHFVESMDQKYWEKVLSSYDLSIEKGRPPRVWENRGTDEQKLSSVVQYVGSSSELAQKAEIEAGKKLTHRTKVKKIED